jgi:hypothetical protein
VLEASTALNLPVQVANGADLAVVSDGVGWSLPLAALGAELRMQQMGTETSPDVRAAFPAAAGLEDLNGLPGPQRDAAIGLIRMTLHHAIELVEDPSRSPGWTYTDPAILQGR